MSGIYGVTSPSVMPDPEAVVQQLSDAIPQYAPTIDDTWVASDGHAALCARHPSRLGDPGHFAQDTASGIVCIFDGVIYRDAATTNDTLVEQNGAQFLLQRYLQYGTDCLAEISGSFNVAWWDDWNHRLTLANDKIGYRLLFYAVRAEILVFASHLARIMATELITPQIDLEGFADLLSYKHVLGERTLFKDVRTLPPASILVFDGDTVALRSYWHVDQVEARETYGRQRIDELADVFKVAVKRAVRTDVTSAIGLTGGLDSRCVLAAAVEQDLPFVTLTDGQPNTTDVLLAQDLAERVGQEHIFPVIDTQQLSEWLIPMVTLQGATIPTIDSHPCQYLADPLPVDTLVLGITVETARNSWLSPEDLHVRDLPSAIDLLQRSVASKTARKLDLEHLWHPHLRHFANELPRQHLETIVNTYHVQDTPLLICDYFDIREYAPKYLSKSSYITRTNSDVYLPYLDHQWVEAVLAVPLSEWVHHNSIRVDLIKRLCPTLLAVPSEKDLIPLSMPAWYVTMVKRYRKTKRYLSQRFDFLDTAPLKAHSHDYLQLSRNEMRPTLTKHLYNPNAAFRKYLQWERVETLLDQHFAGTADWGHLVAALTVFEIAHTLWITR